MQYQIVERYGDLGARSRHAFYQLDIQWRVIVDIEYDNLGVDFRDQPIEMGCQPGRAAIPEYIVRIDMGNGKGQGQLPNEMVIPARFELEYDQACRPAAGARRGTCRL